MTTTPDALTVYLCERVGALRGLDPEDVLVTPLHDEAGGPVYCIVEWEGTDEALVVRLPIDDDSRDDETQPPSGPWRPAAEGRNLALAGPLGVTPATIQFDRRDGLWVYPLWAGAPATAITVIDPALLARVGRSARLLHASGLAFEGADDPFAGMDPARPWQRDSALDLPLRKLNMVHDIIGQCRDVLASVPTAPVPCVNALAPEACFDTGTRVVFLDWRASAMGDPHHDLARLADRANLNADQVGALLDAYFGTEAPVARDRVRVFRLVAAYRRLLEHMEPMHAGRVDPADDVARHHLGARLDACLMILDSASWTGAMDRLSAHRRAS
ncbi:phosphotransferase family protein [Roseospira goensis]|uniref:Aminoglycoside phosphotransferase domain-containing protein n=1 Tax=Roseospira goensis TaxID=391922 RepID=A0A7W6RZ50_9PROT|nr:phosphotransferase [Roseospira goensis]MBB4285222.1 hypothetical protein [Roseospira goensis]